jgi:hypothetical protein
MSDKSTSIMTSERYRGFLIQDGNQVRSEVLGMLRADLYTRGSVSKYSTRDQS